MTYPPPPGGWQDPAGGQPTYIDPVSGQPAAVSPAPTQPYPPATQQPAYPGYPQDQQQYPQPGQPGYPTDPAQQYAQPGQPAYPIDPAQQQYAQPGQPGYPTDPAQQQYAQPGYPTDPAQQYAQPGQPAYPGYANYTGYTGYTTPGMPVGPKNNGLAIASLVVSLAGVLFLACYGGGGLVGLVGAILGHVAKRQIRERNEGGGGMATAGIIIGWITLVLGIVVLVGFIIFIVWASHQPTYTSN
ncbi:MAG TPA: DUF4190 domain-containing protein [Rugosimonospora sp.]|jgi:hypothetical protein